MDISTRINNTKITAPNVESVSDHIDLAGAAIEQRMTVNEL